MQYESAMPRRKASRSEYQPTFIRAWRNYRNLTQEQLAERVDATSATISRLENGKQPYSQELLEAIADSLRCEVADLITRPPHKPKDELLTLLDTLDDERRAQAARILRALIPHQAA